MTAPVPNVIEVAKDDMYREAELWDAQSLRISDCAFQAGHLTVEEYDIAIFNEFLSMYNEVTRVFAKLCKQGTLVTREIGQTLRVVADTFAQADDSIRAQYDRDQQRFEPIATWAQ